MNQHSLNFCVVMLFAAFALLFALGIYIGSYNDLTFDDIARKLAGNTDVLGGAKAFYFGESGRFTNGLLTQHSGLYDLSVYRTLHIFLGMIWFMATWWFVRELLVLFDFRHLPVSIMLTSALLLSMISNAPNLGEWWFWYTTASLYLFGASLLLAGLALLFQALRKNTAGYWLASGIVLFLAGGNSEMVLFACLAISLTIAITEWTRARNRLATIPLLFSLTAGIIVAASPGGAARMEMVSESSLLDQLLDQVILLPRGTLTTLAEGIAYWTRDGLWLVNLLLALLTGWCLAQSRSLASDFSRVTVTWLTGALVLVSQAMLVVLMDWKININDPSRTSNFAYFLFLLVLLSGGLVSGSWLGGRWVVVGWPRRILLWMLPVCAVGLIVTAFSAPNTRVMFEDVRLDKPRRQAESITRWDKLISDGIKAGQEHIVVPNMVPANTLTVYRRGPAVDPDYAMNGYWRDYKNMGSSKLSRTNFDYDLRESLLQSYQPRTGSHGLYGYKDKYRNYLVVQVARTASREHKFCLRLSPDDDASYHLELWDENFAHLEFKWRHNELCTRFGARRMFCERHERDWLCRIPLPMNFTGTVTSQWGPKTPREIRIQ